MKKRTRIMYVEIFSACMVLVIGAMACTTLQERPATSGSAGNLVITPISGLAASAITIRGSGFTPGEKIEIIMVVDGVATELGEEPMIKEANEAGAFKAKSGIPLNAKSGVYSVKATGDKGTVAVAPLEVEPMPEKKK
jgi:hypothetical protein